MDEDHSPACDLQDDIEVIYSDDDADNYNNSTEDISLDIDNMRNVHNVEDAAKVTFRKHNSSVFCSNLNKDGSLAVTGGEDDLAYVWYTETAEVYFECTGHKDSVIEVCFSFDDRYVATADMGGLIQVWSVADTNLVWCYEGDDIEWMIWHHSTSVLIVGGQSGDVYIWQVPQGISKMLSSHGSPTMCSRILKDGRNIVIGYGDGQLKLWDMKTSSVLWQLSNTISKEGIISIDITYSCELGILAPAGQVVRLSDGKILNTLLSAGEKDIETAAFNIDNSVVATGSLSGKLCIWDLLRNALRHESKLNGSITVLKWWSDIKLLVGTNQGCLYVYDTRSGLPLEELTGHCEDILSINICTNKSIVLTTSDDGTAKIFKCST